MEPLRANVQHEPLILTMEYDMLEKIQHIYDYLVSVGDFVNDKECIDYIVNSLPNMIDFVNDIIVDMEGKK